MSRYTHLWNSLVNNLLTVGTNCVQRLNTKTFFPSLGIKSRGFTRSFTQIFNIRYYSILALHKGIISLSPLSTVSTTTTANLFKYKVLKHIGCGRLEYS